MQLEAGIKTLSSILLIMGTLMLKSIIFKILILTKALNSNSS